MEGGNRIVFPHDSLSPLKGYIQGLIAENCNTGLKRRLSWSFTIDFEGIEYRGMKISPSFTIAHVPRPIRDWRDLVGLRADGDYAQDGIEATFYVWEHDYASSFHLQVLERKGASFFVEMSMVVEFSGADQEDAEAAMPVAARCWLPFTGITLSLDTPPTDQETARRAAAEFVDLSTYVDIEANPLRFLPRL